MYWIEFCEENEIVEGVQEWSINLLTNISTKIILTFYYSPSNNNYQTGLVYSIAMCTLLFSYLDKTCSALNFFKIIGCGGFWDLCT